MRSTNAGTSNVLHRSQVYTPTSDGHNGASFSQETSSAQNQQSANPYPGSFLYQQNSARRVDPRTGPFGPPSQYPAAQTPQADNRQPEIGRASFGPPGMHSGSTRDRSEAGQGSYRTSEATRGSGPVQRAFSTMVRAPEMSQVQHRDFSATPNQQYQLSSAQPPTAQQGSGPMAQIQSRTARFQTSQASHGHITNPTHNTQSQSQSQQPSPYTADQGIRPMRRAQSAHTSPSKTGKPQALHQSHWASPTPAGQISSHPREPPNSRTLINTEPNSRPALIKGCDPSVQRSMLSPRQPANPVINTHDILMPDSTANSTLLERTFSGFPAAGSTSVSSAPPTLKIVLPYQLGNGWPMGKEGPQGEPAPGPSYTAPKQTGQQPPISQPDKERPAVSSNSASNPLHAATYPRQPCLSPYATGHVRETETCSGQRQTNSGDPQPRIYPLPRPLHHQTKRCAPDQGVAGSSMPPAKIQRLYNSLGQPVVFSSAASNLVPDRSAAVSQPHEEPSYGVRPGPGKIIKNREDLVQPMRPSDALPKTSYNPATIARDILTAAGRHPTEKRLNHHLEGLRLNFTRVPTIADLSTFRWDVADGVRGSQETTPMPPVPAAPSHPQAHPQSPRRPLPRSTPQSPPQPHPPSPHQPPPQSPPQPSPQSLPQSPPQSLPESLPTQPPPRDHNNTQNQVTSRDPPRSISMASRDTPPTRRDVPPPQKRVDARASPSSARGTLPPNSPTNRSPQHDLSPNLPPGLSRIDTLPASPKISPRRPDPLPPPPPPRTQQLRRSAASSAASTDLPGPATPTTKPKPKGQTTKSQADSDKGAKSAGTKGLPVPEVVIPLSSVKMHSRRQREPGRRLKSAEKNAAAINSGPPVHYQVYPCRWENCNAELHNIGTIKSHVRKVHIPRTVVCKWTDCGNKTSMVAADMFEHMVKEHISRMAWQFGDGPTVPVPGENVTSSAHHASPRD
ncbi:hypothetical protein N7461_003140 [Penicillium sp. DV-2018c]|nr:hypothetical protein N7461_003140 [Penicillium sp. DV-2018c]